jgi:release factor glutamine methyltransferase
VTGADGTAGPPARSAPDAAVVSAGAGDVEARVLVDELAATVGGARHEARFIVDEVLDAGPGGTRPSVVPPAAVAQGRALAARRAAGEPLQYIFGHWPFRGLDLRVDPRVLIPRPETEQVVEVALGEARRLRQLQPEKGLVAVDAGTGSGAIALALAVELGAPMVEEIWATDTSAGALRVAAANLEVCVAAADADAAAGALPPVALVQGSWLAPLPPRLQGRVDLVVSNPPYVTEEEWAVLAPEVRAEPREALVAGLGRQGAAGLADVEAVLEGARRWLGRPGAVVIELAPAQASQAADRARQLGYDEVRVEPDLAGRPRALVARRSGSQ